MAGVKISDLDLVIQLNDSDFIPLARGAETKKIEGRRFATATALSSVTTQLNTLSSNSVTGFASLSSELQTQINLLSATTTTQINTLSSVFETQIDTLSSVFETQIITLSSTVDNQFTSLSSTLVTVLSSGIIGGSAIEYHPVNANVFESDASQTEFRLYGLKSLADFPDNPAAYRVVLDGALQEPEESYTISGNVITFVDPVAAGVRVSVTFKDKNVNFDPVKNVFTGNGIDTEFSLTGFSPSPNAALYRVSIDGVIQEPLSVYNIVSNNIVFAVAPPAGTRIVVISEDVFSTQYVSKTTYVGDGVVDLFPIVGGIPSPNPASYRIDIDGVIQEPGYSYRLVGSSIMLPEPLAPNSRLVIITGSEAATSAVDKFSSETTIAESLTADNICIRVSVGEFYKYIPLFDINGVANEPINKALELTDGTGHLVQENNSLILVDLK